MARVQKVNEQQLLRIRLNASVSVVAAIHSPHRQTAPTPLEQCAFVQPAPFVVLFQHRVDEGGLQRVVRGVECVEPPGLDATGDVALAASLTQAA
jgi:hypothetical protein